MRLSFVFLVVFGLCPQVGVADTFTYRNQAGDMVTIDAKIYGEGQGFFALQKANGQIETVSQRAIQTRVPKEGPDALTAEEMVAELTQQFGEETFRSQIKTPFVCGLVLADPLSSRVEESRCRAFLKKLGDFMKRIEDNFERFARDVHVPLEDPTHPLVVLVFETDADFEKYATESTGGNGLSAGNIAGFYSSGTNFLAIRMSECYTFETPLHEAIHQQVYNRQVFKRFAPLPTWFNEGIATGFEGDGDKIANLPVKVNSLYAKRAVRGSQFGWEELVKSDRTFGGDIFAGDAYMHAWSMHWLLVNNYTDEYTKYVKVLGQRAPLAEVATDQRVKDFEEAFGKSPADIQSEFLPKLKLEVRRQKVRFEQPSVGGDVVQSHLAEVDFGAQLRPQGILVGGKLTNISYIRDMAYYVTIETGSGLYAEWMLPRVTVKRTLPLKSQYARKRVANPDPRLGVSSVRVKVYSAPVDSEKVKAWLRGQVPSP